MCIIWWSLASPVRPHADVAGRQGRTSLLQYMLHALTFVHVTENDPVYLFFNIFDLPIMAGKKITIPVLML